MPDSFVCGKIAATLLKWWKIISNTHDRIVFMSSRLISKATGTNLFSVNGKFAIDRRENEEKSLKRLLKLNRVSCKRIFNKRLKMTDHMRSHTGERFVACLNCGSTFNSYVKFYDHYRRQAINSEFFCGNLHSFFSILNI